MIKIIGISGIGGAGKSVLTNKLGEALNATRIFWDDFDEISEEPEDYIGWYNSNQNYDAWRYDALADTLKKLKNGEIIICPATQKKLSPTNPIIFDAPLGRKHTATGQYIDFLIWLNTPLDIALARRLLRDFRDKSNLNCKELFEELDFYLNSSRPLYTMADKDTGQYDLVLDGSLPIDDQLKIVLNSVNKII